MIFFLRVFLFGMASLSLFAIPAQAPKQKKPGSSSMASKNSNVQRAMPQKAITTSVSALVSKPVESAKMETVFIDPNEEMVEEMDYAANDEANGEPHAICNLDPDRHPASNKQIFSSESKSDTSLNVVTDISFFADPNYLDLLWPVETRSISSAWGPRVRIMTTVVKTPKGPRRIRKPYNSVHKGIDLTAPHGSSVFAAMDGVVTVVARDKKLGNHVKIHHGNGVETVYGHNSANIVKVGSLVRRGQIIACVGSSGHSTGPHVHFEVRVNGHQLNPMPFLNDTEEISAELLAYNADFRLRSRNSK